MSPATLDKLIWLLIYGGLLSSCLGLFVERQDSLFGRGLVVGGGLVAAAGAVLIWVRSRIRD